MGAKPVLEASDLELVFRAGSTLELSPFPGFIFRGAFGRAFRNLVCTVDRQECPGCPRHRQCPYGLVWETPLPLEGAPRRFRTPPRPYLFSTSFRQRERIPSGESFSVGIRFIGIVREYLHLFLAAMRDAGVAGLGPDRVPARLDGAFALAPGGKRFPVFEQEGLVRDSTLRPRRIELHDPGGPERAIRLHFDSPLHLKSRGRLLTSLDPEVLTARIRERFDGLCFFHGRGDVGEGFRRQRDLARRLSVAKEDLRKVVFWRHSLRSRRPIPMEGLVGSALIERVPSELVELWRLAEVIHVGSKVSFGFGKLRVESVDGGP